MSATRFRARGFTVVELLVTVTLVSLLTGTVIATIAGGMRVWSRLEGERDHASWILLAFQQLRGDLRNARPSQLVPFEGKGVSVSFAGVVPARELGGGDSEPGRIAYYFDAGNRRLCRSRTPYRRLSRERERAHCETVIDGVDRARFSYLAKADGEAPEWSGSWEAEGLPLAVRCRLRRMDPERSERVEQELVVELPLGGGA